MVTDEQYKALQKRVDELEKKLERLSRQYSDLYMRKEMGQAHRPIERESNKRDTTRYVLGDNVLRKRGVVLACVKQYIADHPDVTGVELEEIFPAYVQGSLGIVRRAADAEKYSHASRRFFFSDKDILYCADGTYVVCAQWDKTNIDRFIALANDLGYQIERKTKKY